MARALKENAPAFRFFVEMSLPLKHLVMKRGRLLRSGTMAGVQSLPAPANGHSKSWLTATLRRKLAEGNDVNPWDLAHELSRKVKRELNQSVYIEPDVEGFGRYKQLTEADLRQHAGTDVNLALPDLAPPDPMKAVMAALPQLPNMGFDMRGMIGQSALPRTQRFGPSMPSPEDFLPSAAYKAPGLPVYERTRSRTGDISFPLLASLPGWDKLGETTRKMFEVEAAQLAICSVPVRAAAGCADTCKKDEEILAALTELPRMSRVLKNFLLEALTVPDVC